VRVEGGVDAERVVLAALEYGFEVAPTRLASSPAGHVSYETGG
jgi:hypothetical protein